VTVNDRDQGTVTIKNSTDIFGDTTKSITGPDGQNIQSVKKSKDIFGNPIITIQDQKRGSFIIKSSKDIFGNDNQSVTKDGREIISIRNSKDIFGNLETTVKSETDSETKAFLMEFLSDCR
jgi:hypothetical protein